MKFSHFLPTEVIFGAGRFEEAPAAISRFGRRAIIVTGKKAMKSAGFTEKLLVGLKKAGIEALLFDCIQANPDSNTVNEIARDGRAFSADVVVGLGGGSAMDSAKALAVALTHEGPIEDYFRGGPRPVTAATAPVVVIPTTSGSGSHVNNIAVLTRPNGDKLPVVGAHTFPKVAIVDPDLPAVMPPEVTAVTGFDAFAHAMEAMVAGPAHPSARLFGAEAMRLIYANLARAVARGSDLEARAALAWADTLAGWALACAGVVSAHVLGMSLGSLFGITHGRAVALVTAASLERGVRSTPERYAPLACAIGLDANGLDEPQAARLACDSIKTWMKGLGLGEGLSRCGVAAQDLERIARHTLANYRVRVDADPTRPALADLVDVLRYSL